MNSEFMPNPSASATGEAGAFRDFDFKRLFFKHGRLVLICFVATTAIVAYEVKRLPPTYVSTAKILIKLQENDTPSFFSGIAAVRDVNISEAANRIIETEMELAEIWPIAAEAVSRLGLTYDQVYHPPYVHVLQPFADFYDARVAPVFGPRAEPAGKSFADTVEALRASLEAKPVVSKSSDTNSNIIALEIKGVDPELTKRSLEEIIGAYLRRHTKTTLEAGRIAKELIAQRIARTKEEVEAARRKMEAFIAGRAAAASEPGGDPAQAGGGETRYWLMIDRLKARLQQLQTKKLTLQRQPLAPAQEISALDNQIASLTRALDDMQQQNSNYQGSLKELETDLNVKEGELVDLQKRLVQISLFNEMESHGASNRLVVEPPLRPQSSQWKIRLLTGIAASLGGLFLGLVIAGLREILDTRIQTAAQANASLGLPVLGVFPYDRSIGAVVSNSAAPDGRAARKGKGRFDFPAFKSLH